MTAQTRHKINRDFNQTHSMLTALALDLSAHDPHLARAIADKAEAIDTMHHDLIDLLEGREA